MGTWSIAIKSYPDLGLAAMRRRVEGQYRFWLLARHLDPKGRGLVHLGRLRRFLTQHHLCDRRTLRRALRRKSVFWTTYAGILKLVGVRYVAHALDAELRSQPVLIPLVAFASMGDLRAVFVASYASGKTRIPDADTLAALCGRTRRTVIRYLKSAYVIKYPNSTAIVNTWRIDKRRWRARGPSMLSPFPRDGLVHRD